MSGSLSSYFTFPVWKSQTTALSRPPPTTHPPSGESATHGYSMPSARNSPNNLPDGTSHTHTLWPSPPFAQFPPTNFLPPADRVMPQCTSPGSSNVRSNFPVLASHTLIVPCLFRSSPFVPVLAEGKRPVQGRL